MKQILIYDASHIGLSHDDSPLSWESKLPIYNIATHGI